MMLQKGIEGVWDVREFSQASIGKIVPSYQEYGSLLERMSMYGYFLKR